MSSDTNKALARVWFDEVMNGRDPTAIYRTYAEDYRYTGPGGVVEGAKAPGRSPSDSSRTCRTGCPPWSIRSPKESRS